MGPIDPRVTELAAQAEDLSRVHPSPSWWKKHRSTALAVMVAAFVMLLLAVFAIVFVDNVRGGPESRKAAIVSERLLTFQQENLQRTLCVSAITTEREIAKAEAASAQISVFLYLIDHLGEPSNPDDPVLVELRAQLQESDVDLAVGLAHTKLQPYLCPAPDVPQP